MPARPGATWPELSAPSLIWLHLVLAIVRWAMKGLDTSLGPFLDLRAAGWQLRPSLQAFLGPWA